MTLIIFKIYNHHLSISTTWYGPYMLMDILDRTKYPGPLGMDQMSCKPCLHNTLMTIFQIISKLRP